MTDPMTRLRAALDEAEQSVEYAYGDAYWTPRARKAHNELRAAAAAALDAVAGASPQDPSGVDARERIATLIRHYDPNERVIDWEYLAADAILATFPVLSRDIASEIDAEREDTDPDAYGADAYINGLYRAAEIVRERR